MKGLTATAGLMIAVLSGAVAPAEGQSGSSGGAAALLYQHARFGGELEPWHVVTGEALYRRAGISSILRVTGARRFGESGQQVGVEVYPRFGREGYAVLAAAYSPALIFPRWRLAAELYRNVGAGFEASAGARYMRFDSVEVRLVTASVGRYVPHWYLSARSTVVPRADEVLLAGDLLMRRYLDDGGDHVTLRLALGETPAEDVREVELLRTRSLRAGLDGRSGLGGPWDLLWLTAWEREWFPSPRQRTRLEGGLGLSYEF